MKNIPLAPTSLITLSLLTAACFGPLSAPTATPTPTNTPWPTLTPTIEPTSTPAGTPTALPLVPDFSHIVILIFENKEYSTVIGAPDMPYVNLLASTYTLLTQHYATTHPSLPNYISLIAGDTFGIVDDCDFADCYIDAPSLPDLIEASGRTWKTYQDKMPQPCFTGSTLRYSRKHNPFIFFDAIRTNAERCARSVVPLTQMDVDLPANDLPNFVFISPDICASAHDCDLMYADKFIKTQVEKLYAYLDATDEPYLIILTWDEGQGSHSCCGMPELAGGRIATVLISPQVKQNFQDNTPYSHYSILKTISQAWGLSYLGHAADAQTPLITAPWK